MKINAECLKGCVGRDRATTDEGIVVPGCSYAYTRACNYHCRSHVDYRPETPEEAEATAAWAAQQAAKTASDPYNGIKTRVRRERDDEGMFGPIATVNAPERELETCPICGQTDVLTEYEGLKICQTCLEGLAEGGE